MQFTTVIVALFAAVTIAAPAAEPAPAALAAPAAEAQSSFCDKCQNGKKTCCSLTSCSIYSC